MKNVTATRLAVAALLLFSPLTASATPIISVGTYDSSATPFFTVPIVITGATDLLTWQFTLEFDPAELQVYDDPIQNPTPVREGPFTSSAGQHLSLFVPGFVFNGLGLVDIVAGAYVDLPPGPSGDGVLAYVDFIAIGDRTSLIAIRDASTTSAVPEPSSLVLVVTGVLVTATSRRRRRAPWRSLSNDSNESAYRR